MIELIHTDGLAVMRDIANELDEIILPPSQFLITKIDKKNNKIFMKWIRCLNENHM